MASDTLFWLSIGPALAAVIAALIADAFARDRSVTTFAVGWLIAAGGAVGIIGGWSAGPSVVADAFTVGAGYSPASGLVLVLGAASLLGSVGTRFGHGGRGATLVALASLGTALAVLARDLVAVLLCLEVAALSSYALVAASGDRNGREAAMKYFIQGALASGLFVMGVAVIAGSTGGDASYAAVVPLARSSGSGLAVLAALSLVVLALAFKVSAAPLHTWAPDAYENAPAPAAAVLAGPVKLGAMAVLAVLAFRVFSGGEGLFSAQSVSGGLALLLGVLAALSVIVGSLAALGQAPYRRLLGYAGVAQAGYGLLAVAAVNPSAAMVHLSMYAIATVAVFIAADAFRILSPGWDGTVAGLAGLGRRHPVLGCAVLVSLASLAGLPPFGGFWGKFQAFGAPVGAAITTFRGGPEAVAWGYVLLVAVGIVGSVVSVAYYGAIVRSLFFGEATESHKGTQDDTYENDRSDDPRPAMAVAIVSALVLLVAGFLPLVTSVTGVVGGLILRG